MSILKDLFHSVAITKTHTPKSYSKYVFYVGSNNSTGKAEHNKAVEILNSENVKAFTLKKGFLGFWDNKAENSFIIEIISTKETPFNDNDALTIKKRLEHDLNQYLVLTEKQSINLLGVVA